MPQVHLSEDRDHYRMEALGAFAHELRSPLTALRMVVQLGRRQAAGDALVLDAELASMLHESLDHLQQLAEDLHEQSRLERGILALRPGRCDLATAFEAAQALLPRGITIEGAPPPPLDGPWEAERLARAIAGLIEGANRAGDGRGVVRFACAESAGAAELVFASGTLDGEPRPLRADAGFAFFCARQYIMAAGGVLECDRRQASIRLVARLPRTPGGAP